MDMEWFYNIKDVYAIILFVTAEEIDISLRFAKREIQFLSGGSLEYQFEHQYEIHRIDRLQIGGDLEYVEEVALRYRK